MYCIEHSLFLMEFATLTYNISTYHVLQVTCGAELAVLLVETLVKGNFSYDGDTLGQFNNFLSGAISSQHFIFIFWLNKMKFVCEINYE